MTTFSPNPLATPVDRALADTIQKVLASCGLGEVRFVDCAADLPRSLRDSLSDDEMNEVQGCYVPAEDLTYLVRSQIGSLQEAIFVSMHEALHRGMRKAVTDRVAFLELIERSNERVRTATDLVMVRLNMKNRVDAIEEVLADIARYAPPLRRTFSEIEPTIVDGRVIEDEELAEIVAAIRAAGFSFTQDAGPYAPAG